MAMNPTALFKIGSMKKRFDEDHPKVGQFFQRVIMSGLPEGTVIEMTVTKPGEEPISCNMKVNAADLQMMEELKNMQA